MAKILTKADMYALLRSGQLGNTNPSWSDFYAWRASGHNGPIGIRSMIAGGLFFKDINPGCCRKVLAMHFPNGGYNISPMIPNHWIVINAETHGDYMYYSRVQLPMRDSLRKGGKHMYGPRVRLFLRHAMDEPSYENWCRLNDEYEDCVQEFTILTRQYGTLRWNTVFWEVRNY